MASPFCKPHVSVLQAHLGQVTAREKRFTDAHLAGQRHVGCGSAVIEALDASWELSYFPVIASVREVFNVIRIVLDALIGVYNFISAILGAPIWAAAGTIASCSVGDPFWKNFVRLGRGLVGEGWAPCCFKGQGGAPKYSVSCKAGKRAWAQRAVRGGGAVSRAPPRRRSRRDGAVARAAPPLGSGGALARVASPFVPTAAARVRRKRDFLDPPPPQKNRTVGDVGKIPHRKCNSATSTTLPLHHWRNASPFALLHDNGEAPKHQNEELQKNKFEKFYDIRKRPYETGERIKAARV